MTPNLALFSCILFILIVLIIDFKQKSGVSFGLCVPWIWYALVASRGISRWLSPESFNQADVSYLEGNPVERIVFSTLLFCAILILIRRKVDWSSILRHNVWLILLFSYMAISISWSDFGDVSFKRWVKTAGVVVMALVVLTESNPMEAISTLLKRCFYLHLPLSIVLIKYFRNLGIAWDYTGMAEMWVGVTTHKNHLGQIAMISGVYFMWNIIRTPRSKKIFIDLMYIVMVLWLLNGSSNANSMTSTLTFLFGTLILLGLHFVKLNAKYIARYMVVGFLVFAFFTLTLQFVIESISNNTLLQLSFEGAGRDGTLTGRTNIWNEMLNVASHQPMLGVGYGSFWIGDLSHSLWDNFNKISQGHNGYLDVYVELGMVGIFLLIGVIFFVFKDILKTFTFNYQFGQFRFVILSMILLSNITESSFLRGKHNLWFLFLLVAINVPAILQFNNSKSDMVCKS